MKKIIIAMGVAAMALSSCGSGSSALKTEMDSVSYAIGIDLGNYVKGVETTMGEPINMAALQAAMKDVMKEQEKISREDGYNFINEVFGVRRPMRERKAGEAFVEEAAQQPNREMTESGLVYEIIEQGNMDEVITSDKDVVYVVYHGTKRTGEVFDSSRERGDTIMLGINRVIKGWQEGMRLVGKGGKINLWVPSDLAYGPGGSGQNIGPHEALKFEVELIDIAHADEEKK